MRFFTLSQLAAVWVALTLSSLASAATPPGLSPGGNSLGSSEPRYYGGMVGTATVSAGGNAVYKVDLELPPAVRGFAPKLSLNYNSNVRNGLLGMGWFLSGVESKITRCNATFETDGYTHGVNNTYDDRFCLDGQKLLLVSGTYGYPGSKYRIEIDQYADIEAMGTAGNGPEWFRVR
ncbi:MAG: SpvB/TcaC N-terminal domain-containing protein, partial [Pseudomonadota bacterium]